MYDEMEPAQYPSPVFERYAPWAGPSDLNTTIQFMIPIVVIMGMIGATVALIKGIAKR